MHILPSKPLFLLEKFLKKERANWHRLRLVDSSKDGQKRLNIKRLCLTGVIYIIVYPATCVSLYLSIYECYKLLCL
jgi:hypothetical protein